IPLFALAAASSVVTFVVQRKGGAMSSQEALPFVARLANAALSCVKYVGKMIIPVDLAVIYPHPGGTIPWWEGVGCGICIIGVTTLVVRNRRKFPPIAVGWLWYLCTLLPVSGIVQVGFQSMADRYMYL